MGMTARAPTIRTPHGNRVAHKSGMLNCCLRWQNATHLCFNFDLNILFARNRHFPTAASLFFWLTAIAVYQLGKICTYIHILQCARYTHFVYRSIFSIETHIRSRWKTTALQVNSVLIRCNSHTSYPPSLCGWLRAPTISTLYWVNSVKLTSEYKRFLRLIGHNSNHPQ